MAKIDQKTNQVIFTKQEYFETWQNCPIIQNRDSKEFRLCYICKFPMEFKINEKDSKIENAWVIDLINAKKPVLEIENYIGVHANCVQNRKKMDSTKLIKKIKMVGWMAPEDY
ncbi:hypothetical protein CK556_01065 [Mesoplasma chauliocola]|uniref:HNH endonuclease n=1 Tax=Mesoplasma chauliocola TaxID=216427 RepID=A0A249SMV6_9MOLU|nr:hypothetical protein [Mesoplasma chauliocola]ASZ08948.1 hypothetical protein CK556_01065 [Mesoplasma chauliocola]